jgi:hypothetical protein
MFDRTSVPSPTCLSDSQATRIINAFSSFLTDPQAPTFSLAANALLADEFADTSDSINYLINQTVEPPPDHETSRSRISGRLSDNLEQDHLHGYPPQSTTDE